MDRPTPAVAPSDHGLSIWFFAFGYFAAYAPYSALTKALSAGSLPRFGSLSGLAMLPTSVVASMVSMFAFLTLAGWWRFAGRRTILGREWPMPGRWTFLSGLCTAAIVLTTTLAYTFEGVSIVFVMLLMRGGVLVIAPLVDLASRRRVRWFSWVGLALSFAALFTSITNKGSYVVTLACGADIAAYLAAYFVRLRFMSHLAKSSDPSANRRFFVEEQMVATPAAVLLLAVVALVAGDGPLADVRLGWTDAWASPALPVLIAVGLLSQGTGIFGGLILLDARENTFCVPVNRASSVLAGVVASFSLAILLDRPLPHAPELVGAGLVIAAILFLSVPPLVEARRRRQAAAAQAAAQAAAPVAVAPR